LRFCSGIATAFGSSKQNETRRRRFKPWIIRGRFSPPVRRLHFWLIQTFSFDFGGSQEEQLPPQSLQAPARFALA
jgi:hypothetical protein